MDSLGVLIVDDSPEERYILSRILARRIFEDCTIFEASDGGQALELFHSYRRDGQGACSAFPPHFIFLDINMPGKDGFDFLREYNNLMDTLDLAASKIFMFSSSDRQEDQDRAFAYDFVKGYVVKGEFTIESLRQLMLPLV